MEQGAECWSLISLTQALRRLMANYDISARSHLQHTWPLPTLGQKHIHHRGQVREPKRLRLYPGLRDTEQKDPNRKFYIMVLSGHHTHMICYTVRKYKSYLKKWAKYTLHLDMKVNWVLLLLYKNDRSQYLQSPQLGHVVKAGHRQTSDVIVVERTVKKNTRIKVISKCWYMISNPDFLRDNMMVKV